MKIKFRGVEYTVIDVKKDALGKDERGFCYSPKNKKPRIFIKKGLRKREDLYVRLHEGLHACLWDLDEEAVVEIAQDLEFLLTKSGYSRKRK